jgi:hypothetical protein
MKNKWQWHLLHLIEFLIQHPTATEEQYYDEKDGLFMLFSKSQQGFVFWSEAPNPPLYNDFK